MRRLTDLDLFRQANHIRQLPRRLGLKHQDVHNFEHNRDRARRARSELEVRLIRHLRFRLRHLALRLDAVNKALRIEQGGVRQGTDNKDRLLRVNRSIILREANVDNLELPGVGAVEGLPRHHETGHRHKYRVGEVADLLISISSFLVLFNMHN